MSSNIEQQNQSLVREAQNAIPGDFRAFEELVKRFKNHVFSNCYNLTRSSDAEDLAQEVFVKAFFAINKFQGRSNFKTWLQRIKINHCLNYIRKTKQAAFIDYESNEAQASEAFQVSPTKSPSTDKEGRHENIVSVLKDMPDTMRIPLILCDMDCLSYQEAADQLDIGLSALKMRLKRAREYFVPIIVLKSKRI